MDPRLRAIGTPSIRTEAVELVKLALEALDELKKIDESLYGLFVASRNAPANPEMAAAKLRLIWDGAFRPLTALIDYCRRIDDEAEVTVTGEDEADLDFGDFEAQEEEELRASTSATSATSSRASTAAVPRDPRARSGAR